jgi:hypothetical protein
MVRQNKYCHVKQGKSGRTPVKAKPTAVRPLRIFSQEKKATIAAVHRVFLFLFPSVGCYSSSQGRTGHMSVRPQDFELEARDNKLWKRNLALSYERRENTSRLLGLVRCCLTDLHEAY